MSDRAMAVIGLVVSSLGLAWCLWVLATVLAEGPKPKPAPTPAACCNTDHCRQEFAKVDARFGGVWDELVEVQEQLAKAREYCDEQARCSCRVVLYEVKPCECEPSQPCACSPIANKPCCCSDLECCDKPKPITPLVTQPTEPSVNPAPKLQPDPACGRRGRK